MEGLVFPAPVTVELGAKEVLVFPAPVTVELGAKEVLVFSCSSNGRTRC
jgi:hypothetical protein